MQEDQNDYGYVLFIDEAGDDGLTRVQPIDESGGSEWLVIAGTLVRAIHEDDTVEWVREIREQIGATQGPALHYRRLPYFKKVAACLIAGEKPCRSFVVLSNKKNMRGYDNARAARRGGRQWFYNYCVRLLLERATDFCTNHSIANGNNPVVKVVFSRRGGHSYPQTKAYLELLKAQASANSTYLKKRQIRHEALRFNLIEYVPHYQVAGLQLADILASAFYQAVNPAAGSWSTDPAWAFRRVIARENGEASDYGIVLQPTPPARAALTADQKKVFQQYGYEF